MLDPVALRIQSFIENQSISLKDFADKIGVQRSAVSHILSGRNKPSLDFIMKMLQSYPTLDQRWLLHGKGDSISHNDDVIQPSDLQENKPISSAIPDLFSSIDTNVTNQSNTIVTTDVKENHIENKPLKNSDLNTINNCKQIKSILVIYNDGSFESFKH
jgi:transcriptional regulator with XRE-family HTH domain